MADLEMKCFRHTHKACVVFDRPPDNAVNIPHVVWVGEEHRAQGSDVTWERHPQQFIFHVQFGQADLRLGEQSFHLTQGDFIHYPMNTRTRMVTNTREGIRLAAITFLGVDMAEQVGIHSAVFRPENSQSVFELMTLIIQEAYRTGAASHGFCNAALAALLKLIRDGLTPSTPDHNPGYLAYRRLKQLIDVHYEELATVAEVATRCNMTPEHANRLFRHYGGETPLTYLHRRKVAAALQWLMEGHTTREIARRLQYSTPGSFARRFRQLVGQSPSSYRRTISPS